MLGLRQIASNPGNGQDTTSVALSQFSVPNFRVQESIFGNLGEPIGLGDVESDLYGSSDITQDAYEMEESGEDDVERLRTSSRLGESDGRVKIHEVRQIVILPALIH